MKTKILLTSFQTWLPHQNTNSSDDLLLKIQEFDYSLIGDLFFLRNLPVNADLASQRVINEIALVQPDLVVCCGMAEKRTKLAVESNASCKNHCLYTSIDLSKLPKTLTVTEVSHDAGKFVCEGLYYQLLRYIQSNNNKPHCIFIHIPLLREDSLKLILRDFHHMISIFAKTI